jgi:heme a synthase
VKPVFFPFWLMRGCRIPCNPAPARRTISGAGTSPVPCARFTMHTRTLGSERGNKVVEKRARRTRWLAVATAVGMLIVLLMGARVTATGSAEGCGNDWPLCHGQWLPADTFESITEYSHRIVTAAEGLLVAATSIMAWSMRRRYPEVTFLVPAMAGTLVLQSLMGAAAVTWPQSDEVMATHFGISLVCLASAALLARVLNERRSDLPGADRDARRSEVTPVAVRQFRRFAVVSVVASIVVAYSGAYVRHTGAELACTSWPTCNGELLPEFGGLHGIHTLHRLAVLGISLILVGLVVLGYRIRELRPDLFTIAILAIVLVMVQALIGAVVVSSGLQLLATLSHAGVMALLFVTLCDGVRLGWKRTVDPEVEALGRHMPGMALGD